MHFAITKTKRSMTMFLFTGRRGAERSMTTRQYPRLVSEWIGSVGLDPRLFGTHSLRRTKATLIYPRTGNLRCPTSAWPYQNRKHGPVSWHRSRRRRPLAPRDRTARRTSGQRRGCLLASAWIRLASTAKLSPPTRPPRCTSRPPVQTHDGKRLPRGSARCGRVKMPNDHR